MESGLKMEKLRVDAETFTKFIIKFNKVRIKSKCFEIESSNHTDLYYEVTDGGVNYIGKIVYDNGINTYYICEQNYLNSIQVIDVTQIKKNMSDFLNRYIEASNTGSIQKEAKLDIPHIAEYNLIMTDFEHKHKELFDDMIGQFDLRKKILKNNRANMAIKDYNESVQNLLNADPRYQKLLNKIGQMVSYNTSDKVSSFNHWQLELPDLYDIDIMFSVELEYSKLYFDSKTSDWYILYEGTSLLFDVNIDSNKNYPQEELGKKLNCILRDSNCLNCSWTIDKGFDDFDVLFGLDELRLNLKKQLWLLSNNRSEILDLYILIVDCIILDIKMNKYLK
jgi:hypothetical protein